MCINGGYNVIKKSFILKCIYKFNEIGIKIPTGISKHETKISHERAKGSFDGENQSIEWTCSINQDLFKTMEIKTDCY